MNRLVLVSVVMLSVNLSTVQVDAYIHALMPFRSIIDQSDHVITGRIESVDRRNRTAVARIERSIKGKKEYDRVQMNLGVGVRLEGTFLLDIWEPGDPFILFYQRQGWRNASVGHAGDFWFQLHGEHRGDEDDVWWRFTHMEIYLPRTFKGTTPELIELTRDVVSGKRKAPAPDRSVPKINVRKLDPTAARARKGRGSSAAIGLRLAVAVERGSTWKYLKGTREASPDSKHTAWRGRNFEDASWAAGKAPFGYGDKPYGTVLDDMEKGKRPGYSSLFLRRRFEIADVGAVKNLECRVNYDDGFIVWINGRQAAAANVPSGNPRYNEFATGNHESGDFESFRANKPGNLLRSGANVIAVQVFNRKLTSSDLKIDVELRVEIEAGKAVVSAKVSGRFRRLTELKAARGEPRGISWVDIDGNDQLDMYICRQGGNLLLVNEGDRFRDRSKRYGVGKASRAASWVDYNQDHHPDLLTSNFELYRSDAGQLRRSASLTPPPQTNAEGAGWIDYNGDGLPDVLITNGEHGIQLYENVGGKTFRDVSEKAGLGASGLGKGNGDYIVFADYDADGFTDFFYNLGGGVLAHNEGDGTFRLDTESGIELSGGASDKRGATFADIDNDGDLDLFVPGPRRPQLYRNDGTFVEIVAEAGDLARLRQASFSGAWGDVDHDGALDLLVCCPQGPVRLYLGDGKGKYRDATSELGLEGLTGAYAASFADIDEDGDLDLVVNRETAVTIFRNELKRKSGSGPLQVRLNTTRGVIGSVVRVNDENGESRGIRELSGSEGCGGQAAPLAHFGLPVGTYTVTAILSDARVAQKKVEVKTGGTVLTLNAEDFEK